MNSFLHDPVLALWHFWLSFKFIISEKKDFAGSFPKGMITLD